MHVPIKALVIAAFPLLIASSPALAQTYRWVDVQGRETYSNALPADLSSLRELAVLSNKPLSAHERRTVQIINETLQARRVNDATAGASLPPVAADPDASIDFGSPAAPGLTTQSGMPDATDVPTHTYGRGATETVRDPCLLSADPRCHEKHAADYHPYFGYAPSLVRAAHGAAPGATAAAPERAGTASR